MLHNNQDAVRMRKTASIMESGEPSLSDKRNSTGSKANRQEGFTKVPNSLIKNESLSSTLKMFCVALLMFSWNKGYCFPSQKTLASHLRVHSRSIRRYISELESLGFLSIEKRPGKSSKYFLHFIEESCSRQDRTDVTYTLGTKLSDTSDKSAGEEDEKNNKHANRCTEEEACNLEIKEFLFREGVRDPAASIIASSPKASIEYIKKHIAFSVKDGSSLALAIHRMKEGDKAPDICLECLELSSQHSLDCSVGRARYIIDP